MAKCKLLAFLLCERATAAPDPDRKVTLHGLFDRIIVPRLKAEPKIFFVYHKIVVEQPCTITLRVLDPSQGEIQGNWRDSIAQVGPVQSIWALTSSLFNQPGRYVLELRQEVEDSEALSLASMVFVVEQQNA